MYMLTQQYLFKQLDTIDSAAMQTSERLVYQYWIIIIYIDSTEFSLVAMKDKFTDRTVACQCRANYYIRQIKNT